MMLFQNILNWKVAQQKVNHCSRNKRKSEQKSLRRRSLSDFDFCARLTKTVKSDVSGKKGILSCCKSLFEQIEATLAYSCLKIFKMLKTWVSRRSGSQWVNTVEFFLHVGCLFVMFVTVVCFVSLLIPDKINIQTVMESLSHCT